MSKWKTVGFEDVFADCTKYGRKIMKEDYLECGKYPIVDQGQNRIAGYANDDLGIFEDVPAIIFGDHTRIIKYIDEPFFLGADGVKLLKAKEKGTNYKYLFYSLLSAHIPDTGYNRHFKWLKELQIPLPPLEEQKRIADILDKASNLIDLRKQQLEKMDLLIKSKFIDMFGDPVTNPKGWQVQRIEELCEAIFGGGTPSKSHAEYYDGDIPWVTSKDMKSILISDSIDHINDKAVLNSSAKYIPKQSLLMVIRSGILKHTLPLGINTRVVTINQDMKAFIPNANINVWFMFYTFKMHEKSLLSNVRAVTADNIEFSIIKNLKIPVPPITIQNQFAEFVEQVEKQKVVMQQSLEKMEMNYKALMQEYFG